MSKPRFKGKFFLDSGAHSLLNINSLSKRKKADTGVKQLVSLMKETDHSFYETPEFWKFVDSYGIFVNKYKDVIDYYTNIDVIYNPELTYRVQKVLERDYDLQPVPVVHFGTDLKWAQKYIDEGHDFLGVGGLGQGATPDFYTNWADRLFEMICPPPNRLPVVRTHGFAMTSFRLMKKYPWYSVDSASWTKNGGNGIIYVPYKVDGKFSFDQKAEQVVISVDSKKKRSAPHEHYFTFSEKRKSEIKEWVELIGLTLGKWKAVDKEKEDTSRKLFEKTLKGFEILKEEEGWKGVVTHHSERKIANLLYFERFVATLPKYPWPFKREVNESNPFRT